MASRKEAAPNTVHTAATSCTSTILPHIISHRIEQSKHVMNAVIQLPPALMGNRVGARRSRDRKAGCCSAAATRQIKSQVC